jgi:hypothetical protein
MLKGGMIRCLWLGGDGATSPMKKRECKISLNFYGKYNVNGNSTWYHSLVSFRTV